MNQPKYSRLIIYRYNTAFARSDKYGLPESTHIIIKRQAGEEEQEVLSNQRACDCAYKAATQRRRR